MLVLEARSPGRHEAELRVERRVTDNHNQAMAPDPTRVETRPHELRTNALPLVLGQYCHRRKAGYRWSWLPITNLHQGEQNMTGDFRCDGRDERYRIR